MASGSDLNQLVLQTYFSSASPVCQAIERARANAALASGPGAVLGARDGFLLAEHKDWETAFFGCPVVQLSLFVGAAGCEERQLVAATLLSRWMGARPMIREYVTIRVPAEDVPLLHVLEQQGFSVLVPMVTLESRTSGAAGGIPVSEVTLAPVEPQDVPALAEIARRAFVYGRFWVEPRLSRDAAGEMYATWIRNCCNRSLADEVFVARVAGRLVGFIAVRCRRYGSFQVGEINLIAVTPTMRGHGIGPALVEAGRRWARAQVKDMIVRTELPNVSAIRMYEKCGFRVGAGSLYYRLWRLS